MLEGELPGSVDGRAPENGHQNDGEPPSYREASQADQAPFDELGREYAEVHAKNTGLDACNYGRVDEYAYVEALWTCSCSTPAHKCAARPVVSQAPHMPNQIQCRRNLT